VQIDFHHGVTYVVARLAGFSPGDADIIAHSAQYVDDATAEGVIWFDNEMVYERLASAHKMLDYTNMEELANHRVWLPFHFLPGNLGEPEPPAPPALSKEEAMRRSICQPNSAPAKGMMRAVIERQDRPYALYRLGIASHVFVDTWAHQGFVGFQHQVNVARDVEANDEHHEVSFSQRMKDFFEGDWDHIKEELVGAVLPLGHGSVLSYPDRPYLKWSYTNGLNEKISRDNPTDFYQAAKELYQHFRRYQDFPKLQDKVFDQTYPVPKNFGLIETKLRTIMNENGDERHEAWIAAIGDGSFGFAEEVTYVVSGAGSWKKEALNTLKDIDTNEDDPIPFPPKFYASHWKLFHDALQAHRFLILHELLPRFGILSS
jgi:hypothetical protein